MMASVTSVTVIMYFFFFFNDTATTEIYTLSLHDALPIYELAQQRGANRVQARVGLVEEHDVRVEHERAREPGALAQDRKSTRLNSSHANISYAVFCLKKKKNTPSTETRASNIISRSPLSI